MSDGRLLRALLRFDESHERASCGPHATEEQGIVPQWSRVLLHALGRLVDGAFHNDEPFFMERKLEVVFHMFVALTLPSISGVLSR
jgi:hypothetical protein